MCGWNDFSFKNVLGAAYNQVRFIVRNLRYIFQIKGNLHSLDQQKDEHFVGVWSGMDLTANLYLSLLRIKEIVS